MGVLGNEPKPNSLYKLLDQRSSHLRDLADMLTDRHAHTLLH